MSLLNLDHVVLVCADLKRGSAWLERTLGVPLAAGGQHLGFGTHNRLLQLGGGAYLELIAPDPGQASVTRARPFELDEFCPEIPTLVHFVANTANIDVSLNQLFYSPGVTTTMQRGELRWKISAALDGRLQNGGTLPTVIEWPANIHPSKTLPHQGVRLECLVLAMDEATHGKFALVFADSRLHRINSAKPWLGLELQTPRGKVFLNSRDALPAL
jgi:catechol 2,3-dioxygenase-like lactoylglutathione lyase family enzyme